MNQRNILAITIITGVAMIGQSLVAIALGYNDWLMISLIIINHVTGVVITFLIHNKIEKKFSIPSFSITLSLLFLVFGVYILISGFFSTTVLAWEGILITLTVTCPMSTIGYYLGVMIFGYGFRFGAILMVFIGTIYYLILGKIIEKFTF